MYSTEYGVKIVELFDLKLWPSKLECLSPRKALQASLTLPLDPSQSLPSRTKYTIHKLGWPQNMPETNTLAYCLKYLK